MIFLLKNHGNLNIMADENFAVDQRVVRERFTLIAEKFEKKD